MIIVRIAESMGPAVAGVPTELPKVFVIQWSMSRFHPFRRQLLGLLIIAVIALAPAAMAQEAGSETSTPRLELDEVVVTATREPDSVADVPRNITVITAEEIAQAPSNNVVDLLTREAGVNLQSLSGSDKQATVDLRGMGASAANNVIVMVDGVRQNTSDLSGVDFSAIALDQIERIEVQRGSGAVIYGDGAVGGVINIITRSPGDAPRRRIYASYGSFASKDLRAALQDRIKGVGLDLNASYYDSDGYRENSQLRKKDLAAKLDYRLGGDVATLWLTGSHHEDRYGLPGPVSLEDLKDRQARRQSSTAHDEGETTDQRLGAGMRLDLGAWGSLTAQRGYRFRENPFITGFTPLLTKSEQTSEIDEQTKTLNLDYVKDVRLFRRNHRFQLGLDHYRTHYVREELPGGPRENSAVESLGLYINNQWRLTRPLLLSWGYRHNDFDGRFRTDQRLTFDDQKQWLNGTETDRSWDNNAYDVGLTYRLGPVSTLFASYATSFRVPNVDELAEAEAGLEPQKGVHLEGGGRVAMGEKVELSLTGFQTRIQDEIYFNEVNRNFEDPTCRQGIETDLKFYPSLALFLWANYTYTDARFEGSGRRIPLVPEHKASAGLEYSGPKGVLLSLTVTHVGKRFDGDDLTNERFERLAPYTVVDTKITWDYHGLRLFAGVNNLFDELYATTAYSERYYPMPERNFYGGAQWSF